MRLQQIATGGTVNPRRGGQPSVRNTEASTQAVIKAVYVQVLGNGGYAGERMSSEARLENGDISLKDFVRAVARSDAFRRRYWSGLYIVKAIEVMHRRLLGRPTFGRWEIDALFDTAARHGFYGVVDALIDSKEYSEASGPTRSPYERFITPGDVNCRRRLPAGRARLMSPPWLISPMSSRPEFGHRKAFRSSGTITPRNLVDTKTGPKQTDAHQRRAGATQLAVGGAPAKPGPRPNRLPDASGQRKTWPTSLMAARMDESASPEPLRGDRQDPGPLGMGQALANADA